MGIGTCYFYGIELPRDIRKHPHPRAALAKLDYFRVFVGSVAKSRMAASVENSRIPAYGPSSRGRNYTKRDQGRSERSVRFGARGAPGFPGPRKKSPPRPAPHCGAGRGIFFFSPRPVPRPGPRTSGAPFLLPPAKSPLIVVDFVPEIRIAGAKFTRNSGAPDGAPQKKAGHRKYRRGPVAVHRAGPLKRSPAPFPSGAPHVARRGGA